MDQPGPKSKESVPAVAAGIALVLVLATTSCGDSPVDVSDAEIWRIELEQLDDGTEAPYPRRGTVNLRLRLNRTTQPDPACAGESFETVTTFLADVEALPSRVQAATTGTADGSWNCFGLAATVRLDDGTSYELRSDRASRLGGWPTFRDQHRWRSGARSGLFRFVDGDFGGRLRESHVDVLVQNRTDREWTVALTRPTVVTLPVYIEYAFDPGRTSARDYAFESVPAASTVTLSWPSHGQRRTGVADPTPSAREAAVIPPDRTTVFTSDLTIRCYLAPDHPDQVQLILDEDEELQCGEGWIGRTYLVPARSPLFLEARDVTVQDTVSLIYQGLVEFVVESPDPAVTAATTFVESGVRLLTVMATPDAPRTEHVLRVVARGAGSLEDVADSLFLPVHVYELDVAPASDTLFIPPGGSDTTSLLLDTEGVFDDIRFSVTDLPAGVLQSVPSFDPGVTNVKVGAGSVITVPVAPDAGPGTYAMTVCATIVADPRERCHAAPLVLVVGEEDDGGESDPCQAFELRLDFDPVEVFAGASDVAPVFVDRTAGFDGPVELTLEPVSGGPAISAALSGWSLSPNPVGGGGTFSLLSFTVRDALAVGARYDLRIAGGSPSLGGALETCSTPITFEVIGP